MGGVIEVRGREGGGSVFTFTIPLRAAGQSPAAAESAAALEADFSNVHILLVEDEPSIGDVILLFLAQNGCRAAIAENGLEDLRKWEEGRYGLIFMDLQMPEMDGLTATRRIRELEAANGKRTCIVGLTAHGRQEIVEERLAAGMEKVLSKPVPMNELFSAIESCRAPGISA
jgi:CheY-like chemotaxis protein